MSMLPAAISCRCGFQKWVRAFSISVTCALLRLPSRSPSRVASSSPPAPPPTITIRCKDPGRPTVEATGLVTADSFFIAWRSMVMASARAGRHVDFDRIQDLLRVLRVFRRLPVEDAAHARFVELVAPLADDDRGDAVADQIGQGPRLRHEAIDAEDESEPGDRHM